MSLPAWHSMPALASAESLSDETQHAGILLGEFDADRTSATT